jgi:hypothetical protein
MRTSTAGHRLVRAATAMAAAGLVVSAFSAPAHATPLEFGAIDCSAGTVVGNHVEFTAPDGRYVKDNLTLTPQAAAALEARTATLQQGMQGVAKKKKIKVPVAFHVINKGQSEADGNLPQSKIDAQIKQMNKAYKGKESAAGANTKIKFKLKSVTRTTNATWYNGAHITANERAMKTALREGGYGTLNIYTTNLTDPSGGILGYAYLPAQQVGVLDGVVMERRTVPGGGLPPYDGGDTATHEVGHWMGLYHTFQGGCSGAGDSVADTPFEASPEFNCNEARDICASQPGKDPVHNYMDYSDDDCLDQFTKGQKTRMADQWNTYRKGK